MTLQRTMTLAGALGRKSCQPWWSVFEQGYFDDKLAHR